MAHNKDNGEDVVSIGISDTHDPYMRVWLTSNRINFKFRSIGWVLSADLVILDELIAALTTLRNKRLGLHND